MEWKKGLVSGIIAGIVFTVISTLFMMVPGSSEWYAATFPQWVTPIAMTGTWVSLFLVGLFMGLFYPIFASAIPGEGAVKGVKYGLMVWLLTGLMWPFMMMGFASANIWGTELVKGIVDYAITGALIAVISKKL